MLFLWASIFIIIIISQIGHRANLLVRAVGRMLAFRFLGRIDQALTDDVPDNSRGLHNQSGDDLGGSVLAGSGQHAGDEQSDSQPELAAGQLTDDSFLVHITPPYSNSAALVSSYLTYCPQQMSSRSEQASMSASETGPYTPGWIPQLRK